MSTVVVDDMAKPEREQSFATSTAAAPEDPPPLPIGKAGKSRSTQESNDVFAGLAGLMRSKKPWDMAQNTQSQRFDPHPSPRTKVPLRPSPKPPMLPNENLRIDGASELPLLIPAHENAHKDTMGTADVCTPNEDLRIDGTSEPPLLIPAHENAHKDTMGTADVCTPTENLRIHSTQAPLLIPVHENVHKDAMNTASVSTIPAASLPHKKTYDEAKMRYMDELIAEMRTITADLEDSPEPDSVPADHTNDRLQQVEPSSQMLAETPSSEFDAANVQSSFQNMFREPLDKDQGINIRLPQTTWDNMMDQIATLKKEKLEALTRLSNMKRDEHLRQQTWSDNSTMVDQLQYRVKMNEEYKAAMNREIRQKDAKIYENELENQALKDQLTQLAATREQLYKLRAENDFLRAEASNATDTANRSGADVGSFAQLIEAKDDEISHLKNAIKRLEEKITQIETQLSGHQTRADNLADTQAVRERKLKQTEQQLAVAHDSKEKLLDDLDHAKTENTPLKLRIKEMESQLREKTSSCDRMRNDLKHTEKRLDVISKALNKVENHDALKGAAHAIVPSESTKLPKLVLPCIECFAKNITCDSNSRCQNCLNHGEKCLRWKCSQMHILRGGCEEFPCLLHHDLNGWLMLRHEQPQW